VTPSGVTSVPVGIETPDMIELRKRRIEDAMDQGGDTPALYHIIPEKKTSVGAAMMGSTHAYDLAAAVSSLILFPFFILCFQFFLILFFFKVS